MLKPSEREKLQDCLLLIESARDIIHEFRDVAGLGLDEIERCFRDADQTIMRLLRA